MAKFTLIRMLGDVCPQCEAPKAARLELKGLTVMHICRQCDHTWGAREEIEIKDDDGFFRLVRRWSKTADD